MIYPTLITLTEYQAEAVPAALLPHALAAQLQQQYGHQIQVDFSWADAGTPWRLTSRGWVGYIPLSPQLHLHLQPKTSLANLFGMLEYAYQQRFTVLEGIAPAGSLPEFFERLAQVLANWVLNRARQGLHRAYLPHTDQLPYLRGRLNMQHVAHVPGRVNLPCAFEEHTADIEDNRILLYTLWLLSRAVQQPQARQTVQQAYRALHGQVELTPVTAETCLHRVYHRLNEDYRPLHALCTFFLDQLGPAHHRGDQHNLPFLVDMAGLFERFVAEWLRRHCPDGLRLRVQAPVNNPDVKAVVDLVLVDVQTGAVRYVLDTKYKLPDKISERDIYQVLAYAQDRNCPEAILIYPAPLSQPFQTQWGPVRVRSLAFDLNQNLEQAGQAFLRQLLPQANIAREPENA